MRLLASTLAASILLPLSAFAASPPKSQDHKVDNQPQHLFFFAGSDVAIYRDGLKGRVYRSTDAGNEWKVVEELPADHHWMIQPSPHNGSIAVALDSPYGKTQYITQDKGETWRAFETEVSPDWAGPLDFHADDPDRILFNGLEECGIFACVGTTWYTKDGFKTQEKLRDDRRKCQWAKSKAEFADKNKDIPDDRIVCVVVGKEPWKFSDHRLVMSDDFFRKSIFQGQMNDGRTQLGIAGLVSTKVFLIASAKAEGTNELALFTTTDTMTWRRAEFHGSHRLVESMYTILESTNHSIQVNVRSADSQYMGFLFTSDANGNYFTVNEEHTNCDNNGVDFEKIDNIEGIEIVNKVKNWEDVMKSASGKGKQVISEISFNAGRDFQPLKVDDKDLHLHHFTEASKELRFGRIFSTTAPGIVMGVGNTGEYLEEYSKGNFFVSHDSGAKWIKALDGPHIYEIGDQGSIIVAMKNEKTSEVLYSKNYGKDFEKFDLGRDVIPVQLVTTVGSTGLKFILVTREDVPESPKYHIIHLDFHSVFDRKCDADKDFEDWNARVDDKGDSICIMGRKQSFRRRKMDADCRIEKKFVTPAPKYDECDCTDLDYECDANQFFVHDGKDCVLASSKIIEPGSGQCKNPEDEFKGPSGYRLIPGNVCKKKKGYSKDEPKMYPCKDSKSSGKITSHVESVTGSRETILYLERTSTSSGEDETVVLHTGDGKLKISYDHGKNWESILTDESITAVVQNPYFHDHVFFLTSTQKVFYSKNRAQKDTIHSFEAPTPPSAKKPALQFHPRYPDWFIWTGSKDCPGSDCHNTAFVTYKSGEVKSWKTLAAFVDRCLFVAGFDKHNNTDAGSGTQYSEDPETDDKHFKLIYCMKLRDENVKEGRYDLIASEDNFEHKSIIQENVVNFATMEEFVVVAAKDPEDERFLKAYSSTDGKTLTHARFPSNLELNHELGYTVLDSSTHAIFLHVTTSSDAALQRGHIVKSDSFGANYVLSAYNVNRGAAGYTDFERMQGIEGVGFINVVANADDIDNEKANRKVLTTKVTHNDGADWDLIEAPKVNAEGKPYDCPASRCRLNLHLLMEQINPGHSGSSASAVGVMLATGTVGESLGPISEAETFMTDDGGITWRTIKSGSYVWEFGDQGSIIVLAPYKTPTKSISYSRDAGKTWTEWEFARVPHRISKITTVPSDTSFNFLLVSREDDGELKALINVDFSGLFERKCVFSHDSAGSSDSDYELWRPKHPHLPDGCLFGHKVHYYRKKPDADCGNFRIDNLLEQKDVEETCSCDRRDFECDHNYERQSDSTCILVTGLTPDDPRQICKANSSVVSYRDPSGYRRIPMSTCKGGRKLDETGEEHACPGREDEYNEKHRAGFFAIFFAVVIPIGAACGVGYYVWQNWDGKFGHIRLGENGDEGLFDTDSPWVKLPLTVLSGVVAAIATVPMLVVMLSKAVASRLGLGGARTYTSRSSFARGRGDYDVVDTDEGGLLPDEDEEEW